MLPVEIFKTDVQEKSRAENIIQMLQKLLPMCRINFDLEDNDNILRVQGYFDPAEVMHAVEKEGNFCIQLN